MPPDFTTPSPNDAESRRCRNANLSNRLANTTDDVREAFLETLASGRTRWRLVLGDGSTRLVSNSDC